MKFLTKIFPHKILFLILFSIILSGCRSPLSKEASQKFSSRTEPFSVTVLPVKVVTGSNMDHDVNLAQEMATFLIEENLAKPIIGEMKVDVPVKWGRDQSKMFRQSATNFSLEVKETGIETQYALFIEILCNNAETHVGGVHFFLSDQDGLLASLGLTNSHWEEFKEVMPHDRHGGYEVAIRMIRNAWKQG